MFDKLAIARSGMLCFALLFLLGVQGVDSYYMGAGSKLPNSTARSIAAISLLKSDGAIVLPENAQHGRLPKYSDYQIAIWFLKSFENFRSVAEWDNKQYTYGWGNKAPHKGATISRNQADSLFLIDINARHAKLLVTYPNLAEDRFVALMLTDFMFNVGSAGPALRRAIKRYNPRDVSTKIKLKNQMLRYIHSDGEVSDGLIRRRKGEVEMIMSTPTQRQLLAEPYRKEVERIYIKTVGL